MAGRRWWFGLVAFVLSGASHAQSSAAGPIATSGGALQFVANEGMQIAQIDGREFDRVKASRLRHFDDPSGPRESVSRMIVETGDDLVLYDFRRNPPVVEKIGRRLKLVGVYWQPDEAVLKSTDGWFKFQRGKLTKLTSSKTIYH